MPSDCDSLPNLCEITAAHLERAAKRQGVKIRRGDTIFIRTGWGQLFTDVPRSTTATSRPGRASAAPNG